MVHDVEPVDSDRSDGDPSEGSGTEEDEAPVTKEVQREDGREDGPPSATEGVGGPGAANAPSAGAAEAPTDPPAAAPADEAPHAPEEADVVELVVEPPEPTEAERLRLQLDEAQARLRSVSKAYTDLQAEMKSFRERFETQAKVRTERQAYEVVKAFFDPVQNLKRCVAAPPGTDQVATLMEGLGMVSHQFDEALSRLGLTGVPGVGSDFNPAHHEAIGVTPVTDASQDGKVLVVYADGFLVNGRTLQAAQVVIGKYQEPKGEA